MRSLVPTLFATVLAFSLTACSDTAGPGEQPSDADRPPVVSLSATPSDGTAPLDVVLDASVSRATGEVDVQWSFGDGAERGGGVTAAHTYVDPGTYLAEVRVRDATGLTGTATARITVHPAETPDQEPDASMRYRGEWLWAVAFESGMAFEGFLGIDEPFEDEDGELKGVEAGAWRWCVLGLDACDHVDGVGMFAHYRGDISVGFVDGSGLVKLAAIDRDGRISINEDGHEVFSGIGEWYFDSGGSAPVGVALVRFQDEPVYDLAPAIAAQRRGALGALAGRLRTPALPGLDAGAAHDPGTAGALRLEARETARAAARRWLDVSREAGDPR